MGSDNFTGIVIFNCIKNNNYINKYTIIQSQAPSNFKSLDHFKTHYDLNKLKWYKTLTKSKEIADKCEETYTTQHGIIYIDYTYSEPIESKLMYSNELKQLITTQTFISVVFNYFLYLLYLIFMLKLLSNLYY